MSGVVCRVSDVGCWVSGVGADQASGPRSLKSCTEWWMLLTRRFQSVFPSHRCRGSLYVEAHTARQTSGVSNVAAQRRSTRARVATVLGDRNSAQWSATSRGSVSRIHMPELVPLCQVGKTRWRGVTEIEGRERSAHQTPSPPPQPYQHPNRGEDMTNAHLMTIEKRTFGDRNSPPSENYGTSLKNPLFTCRSALSPNSVLCVLSPSPSAGGEARSWRALRNVRSEVVPVRIRLHLPSFPPLYPFCADPPAALSPKPTQRCTPQVEGEAKRSAT